MKNVAAIVACFTVCIMFTGCPEDKPDDLGTEAMIESFSFAGIDGSVSINEGAMTITAKATEATDLTKIKATFRLSEGAKATVGGTKQVSGDTENDFTNMVTYTVTSEDKKTTNPWKVTITKGAIQGETEADFKSFTFTGIDGSATINTGTGAITAKALGTTDLTKIKASFTLSDGASAKVGGTAQVSGTTENNFSTPVTYVVTSGNGTTKNWTVTISKDVQEITELTNAMINLGNVELPAGEYLVKTNLTLSDANKLTIKPGVVIKFEKDRNFSVEGTAILLAEGTEAQPILFTSTTANESDIWHGFSVITAGCKFEYCIFENGSGSNTWSREGMLWVRGNKVSVKNCIFRNGKYSGIYLYDAASGFTVFENNRIENCGEAQDGAYPIKATSMISLLGVNPENTIVSVKGIGILGGTVNQSMSLETFAEYIITGNVDVNNNAVLTIKAGAKLKFDKDRYIDVNNGRIVANGTDIKGIVFTSNTETKQPGDWGGIIVESLNGSQFEYCTFEYGSGSTSWNSEGMLWVRNCSVSVKNCKFENSKYSGIYLYEAGASFAAFENNTIVNCGENGGINAFPIKVSSIVSLAGVSPNNTVETAKGIGVYGGTVNKNMTLEIFAEYIVKNDIDVNSTATLTIKPGAVVKFDGKNYIDVNNGILIAKGTADKKISFTSAAPIKDLGDWGGITIQNTNGSEFEHCNFQWGSSGSGWNNEGFIWIRNCRVFVKDCSFKDAKNSGIVLYEGSASFLTFEDNKIENCGEEPNNAFPVKATHINNFRAFGNGNVITTSKGMGIGGGTATYDINLKKFPYIVYNDIDITSSSGARELKIDAGSKFTFRTGTELYIGLGGRLIADGSTEKITFTGAMEDNGYWYGIRFYDANIASGNLLDNCEVFYGGQGNSWNSRGNISCIYTPSSRITIRNCNIAHSGAWGIYVYSANGGATVDNISYSDNTSGNSTVVIP